MALGENIYAKLSVDGGVLAACGLTAPTLAPVYPVKAPAGDFALPVVVWLIVVSIPDATQNEPAGIDSTVLQFSCYGKTYDEARTLRKAVRAALDGQTLAGGEKCTITAERDLFESQIDAHHCVLEVHLMRDALA
jgi:hypothetical protein